MTPDHIMHVLSRVDVRLGDIAARLVTKDDLKQFKADIIAVIREHDLKEEEQS